MGGPLMALAALEAALWATGAGVHPSFTVTRGAGGSAVIHDNPDYGRLWFPVGAARSPVPFTVAADKPGIRVVVLGESAAMGDPVPAFGLAPALEVVLRHRLPGVPVEVINAGMTAIDAPVVAAIARDLAPLRPDALVFYVGNNEWIGPFAPAPDDGAAWRLHPAWTRVQVAVRRTRIGQWAGRWIGERSTDAVAWRGLEAFADHHRAGTGSATRAAVSRRFAAQMEILMDTAEAFGAEPVVCTVATRLTWPPFGPGTDRSPSPGLIEAEGAGRWREVVRLAGELAEAEPAAARWPYREGRAWLALGEPEAARAALSRARDLDALGFRADTELQEITRRIAAARGVLTVDLARDLEARVYEADRHFWDHVHFTPEGNVAAALHIAAVLAPRLSARRPGMELRDAPAPVEVLRGLLYTEWDRMQATAIMHQRLLAAPMNGLEDHTALIEPLTEGLRTLRRGMSRERIERTVETYRAAVQREPRRLDLLERLVRLYAATDRHGEAVEAARALVTIAPHHRAGWSALGRALVRRGEVDEGFAALRRGEGADPRGAEAAAALEVGAELAADGHVDLARTWFDRVIAADPTHARAWYNRGLLARRSGDHGQASADFQRALELDPSLAEAWNNLGVIALLEERPAEAITALDRALDIQPFLISALRNRAVAANLTGDWDTALALTRRLAPLDPDPGPAPPAD